MGVLNRNDCMSRVHVRRRVAAAVGALAVAAVVSACGSQAGAPVAPTGQATSPAAASLPDSIKKAGTIRVAVTATYPPYEYLDADGKTVIGLNPDVLAEAGKRLGVKIEYQNIAEFGSLLTGIAAGRQDAGIIFADTAEREQVVDLVSFFNDGLTLVAKSGVQHSDTMACGKSVDVAAGSLAALKVADLSKQLCESKGQPAFVVQQAANTDLQFVALNSGRTDFVLTSAGVGAMQAKQSNDAFAVVSDIYFPTPNAVAVSKNLTGLSTALRDTFQQMIDDGTMKTIFDKWASAEQMVPKAGINVVGNKPVG